MSKSSPYNYRCQTWSVVPNTLPSFGRTLLVASRSASNARRRSAMEKGRYIQYEAACRSRWRCQTWLMDRGICPVAARSPTGCLRFLAGAM